MGIKEYLEDLLNDRLHEIKFRFRTLILEDIKNRMCSLLSKWHDEQFRNTILFVTDEEALFYEPLTAADDVRRFVVATIRNSMLEVAASKNCVQFKMPTPLSDDKIREITSEAIAYFRRCDFEELYNEARNTEFDDVYATAIQKYPLAWEILKRTAVMNDKEEFFEKIENCREKEKMGNGGISDCGKVIADGFSLEFDEVLRKNLTALASGETDIFLVDSFKVAARNFEKLLHILQIVMENDKVFMTCNYYISNGRSGKRKRILRAAHDAANMFEGFNDAAGLPQFFKELIREIF